MISSTFATEQIQRLSGLSFFPTPKKGDPASIAAHKELRLALECAATDSIGKIVVDDWLKNNADAPKPAELRRAAYDENERLEREEAAKYKPPEPRRAHCYQCQDFGIMETTDAGDIRSVASYCDCAVGRQRRAEAHGRDEHCIPPKNPCVDCVNAARRKLVAVSNRNRVNPSSKDSPMRNVAEVYSGGF